jgi:hypothetical protein
MKGLTSPVSFNMFQCFWCLRCLDNFKLWNFIKTSHCTQFQGFHMAFPPMITLTSWVREPLWKFCWLLGRSFPSMHSGNKKTTTEWILKPTVPPMRGL